MQVVGQQRISIFSCQCNGLPHLVVIHLFAVALAVVYLAGHATVSSLTGICSVDGAKLRLRITCQHLVFGQLGGDWFIEP
jgi:hypothetical protein